MAITFEQHRTRIGRFILFSSFGLILLIFLLWFLGGFDDEEFQTLLKMIAPIKAVYLSALIKYIIANPHQSAEKKKGKKQKPLNKMYLTTSWLIISTHMISLIILVTLTAFFNSPSFDNLLIIISAVETFFGVYVGLFLTNLFEAKKETT